MIPDWTIYGFRLDHRSSKLEKSQLLQNSYKNSCKNLVKNAFLESNSSKNLARFAFFCSMLQKEYKYDKFLTKIAFPVSKKLNGRERKRSERVVC